MHQLLCLGGPDRPGPTYWSKQRIIVPTASYYLPAVGHFPAESLEGHLYMVILPPISAMFSRTYIFTHYLSQSIENPHIPRRYPHQRPSTLKILLTSVLSPQIQQHAFLYDLYSFYPYDCRPKIITTQ